MSYSEDSLLDIIDTFFPRTHQSLLLGRGDDCAFLPAHGPLCLSTDIFSENSHFRRSYFTPADIGHKALAVNISDIAACGGRPLSFSLGLSLPVDMPRAELTALFEGMARLARQYDLALSGGDLSRADTVQLCLTIWGDAPGNTPFLQRGSCQPGDCLFVVEPDTAHFSHLGLARLGFELLEQYGRAILPRFPAACAAHLHPMPCVAQGRILARTALQFPQARIQLMDLSDGLARDLPRLLGNAALGAESTLPCALLHPELVTYTHEHGMDPAVYAFTGGEDYLLLGSCAPDFMETLRQNLPELMPLGHVRAQGFILDGKPYTPKGFDHFYQ